MAMGIDHNPNANLWGGSQQTAGGTTTFGAFSVNFGAGGTASTVAPTTNNAGVGAAVPGAAGSFQIPQQWLIFGLVAGCAWMLAKHK